MNQKFKDNRGELFFPFKKNSDFKQCTVSCNKKNVFRGIHINPFDKLYTIIFTNIHYYFKHDILI